MTEQELDLHVFDTLYMYLTTPLDRLSYVKSSPNRRLGRGHKDVRKQYAVVQAYRSSVSIKQIASRLECTYANVWRVLKDEGELARRKVERTK